MIVSSFFVTSGSAISSPSLLLRLLQRHIDRVRSRVEKLCDPRGPKTGLVELQDGLDLIAHLTPEAANLKPDELFLRVHLLASLAPQRALDCLVVLPEQGRDVADRESGVRQESFCPASVRVVGDPGL